jgi:hypothetical protein
MAQAHSARRVRSIFFPWESQGGWRRFLGLAHVGPVVVVISLGLFVAAVARRERSQLAERRTLVALSAVKRAVLRYVVEHDGQCPDRPELLQPEGARAPGGTGLPMDGWGRPIRIVCNPSVSDQDYLVMSDGPDGRPGGLDRIEY